MFKLSNSKVSSSQLNKIHKDVKEKNENEEYKKLKSLLSRKDVIDLENDKVDALRMFLFHLENKTEFNTTRFVKFLKK